MWTFYFQQLVKGFPLFLKGLWMTVAVACPYRYDYRFVHGHRTFRSQQGPALVVSTLC